MSSACHRWIELSDREALGETLTDEDRAFQRDHAGSCAACREEAGVWRSLGEHEVEAAPSEREIDAVLLAAQRTRSRVSVLRRGPVAATAATALACAAAIALWVGLRPAGESSSGKPSDVSAQRTRGPAVASPNPQPGTGSPANAPLEPSCSEVVSGVTLCVRADGRIGSAVMTGSDRTIELNRGHAVVSLVPQPPGTTFSVVTPSGKVTAVGTIFSVEIDASNASVVRVIEGRVLVQAKATGTIQPLNGGEMLRIGQREPATLLPGDREKDLALLPPHARAHEKTTGGATAPSAGATQRPSQEQMLEQAQALRARGEFRRAVELYRQIHELGPGSATGRAALVAQGELQLSSLGDPKGALNAFNAYLTRGGPLSQEASFGKARALRVLGRQAEERRTIEKFVATYPDAPQSRVLRRRLAELE
jgi:ferric-dicitrate binding protein FerR (iron transport regulator)